MKVALVYDRVNKWGGAERVLLVLHELFPNAPLYTSVYNSKKTKWAEVFNVKTSFLQRFPNATDKHEFYAPFMPHAFESFSFDGYDLVISVTSEAAKGIMTKPKTKHICYCLTPTRYLWSGYDEYFSNRILRSLSKPVVSYLRRWDKIASKRPDKYIAISKEVQKRIKKYYGKESEVIYPPVTLADAGDSHLQHVAKGSHNKYFLIVSRMVPYKRVDIAIKAFNKLKLPLKIVGTGVEEKRLKKIAMSNIEFLGNLTDMELLRYYKGSSALVFPTNEDFGLAILEAKMFGKPVIAFRKGGALETIIDGKTGEFFYPQHEDALIKTLQGFIGKKYKISDCIKQAEKFNKERFKQQFLESINRFFREIKK